MIQDWLKQYGAKNKEDAQQALREIMQEIALAGLYRAGFFEKAAFYGGTALRIFHKLPRYSEDLDFSLLKKDPNFKIEAYLKSVAAEFEALGMKISVRSKDKSKKSAIDSAFLKNETYWNELVLEQIILPDWKNEKAKLKIKLEVDTDPPLGFQTEDNLLLKPFSCYIKCFSLPDLFAGKVHALLFRKWKTRVKGRDWFDFEWYIKQGFELNASHLETRAIQSGDWNNDVKMGKAEILKLISERIKEVSIQQAKEEVARFVPNRKDLDIWSEKYFLELLKYLKVSD